VEDQKEMIAGAIEAVLDEVDLSTVTREELVDLLTDEMWALVPDLQDYDDEEEGL
jgi:hypothetical protein